MIEEKLDREYSVGLSRVENVLNFEGCVIGVDMIY